jgi:hypothetical protein
VVDAVVKSARMILSGNEVDRIQTIGSILQVGTGAINTCKSWVSFRDRPKEKLPSISETLSDVFGDLKMRVVGSRFLVLKAVEIVNLSSLPRK